MNEKEAHEKVEEALANLNEETVNPMLRGLRSMMMQEVTATTDAIEEEGSGKVIFEQTEVAQMINPVEDDNAKALADACEFIKDNCMGLASLIGMAVSMANRKVEEGDGEDELNNTLYVADTIASAFAHFYSQGVIDATNITAGTYGKADERYEKAVELAKSTGRIKEDGELAE